MQTNGLGRRLGAASCGTEATEAVQAVTGALKKIGKVWRDRPRRLGAPPHDGRPL